jgi:MFS family permease
MRRSPRRAVAAAFLIHATVSGTWAPRLPAIKESLGLSDGELGTALVGLAIGLVVGTRVAGGPIDRWGSRPFMRAGFPVLAAALLLPALAGSGATLFLALLVLGAVSGALDVVMNAQGIEVERTVRKPILSGLHGLWSVGLGVGAGAAALAAAAGLDPLPHFAIVAGLLALASLVFLRDLLPETEQVRAAVPSGEEVRGALRWTLPMALLGVIVFCSFVGEGSAADWSAVYMTQELGTSQALGALGSATSHWCARDRLWRRAGWALASQSTNPPPRSPASPCSASDWRPWCRSPSRRQATSIRAQPAAWSDGWQPSATSDRWRAR